MGEKIKSNIIKWFNDNNEFLMVEEDYEPLTKCKRTFMWSVLIDVISLIALMILIITQNDLALFLASIFLISLAITCITFISAGKMARMLLDGEIQEVEGLVLKNNIVTKKINIVTEDKNNIEMCLESDISVKKNIKYKFYFYEKDDEYIVTYAGQLTTKKEKFKKYDETAIDQ